MGRHTCILLALGLAACTLKQQRAALVPHQHPILRSGQPVGGKGEFGLGSSAIGFGDPELAPDTNAGLYIPSAHATAGLRMRAGDNMDLGLIWDHGFQKGADPIQPGQPPLDHGDVMGVGASMFYSAATGSPALRIGIGAELTFYSVPYVEYTAVCADVDCNQVLWEDVERQRETIPVFSVGVIPNYRVAPNVSLFGGLTIRNHPTVPRTEMESGPDAIFDDDPIEAGPANFIASAGIEVELTAGIRGSAIVFQPIKSEPVRYKPAVGFNFTIPIGRDKPHAAAPPPAAGPTPYPAPGYPNPPPPPPPAPANPY